MQAGRPRFSTILRNTSNRARGGRACWHTLQVLGSHQAICAGGSQQLAIRGRRKADKGGVAVVWQAHHPRRQRRHIHCDLHAALGHGP